MTDYMPNNQLCALAGCSVIQFSTFCFQCLWHQNNRNVLRSHMEIEHALTMALILSTGSPAYFSERSTNTN